MEEKTWCDLTGANADTRGKSAEKVVIKNGSQKKGTSGYSDDSVYVSYNLKGFWHQKNPFGQKGYSVFEIPEAGLDRRVGYPMLAREGLFIEIPLNAVFETIDVKIVEHKTIPGEYNFLPVPDDMPENRKISFKPNKKIYSLDDPYPETSVEFVETVNVMNVPCVHLCVYPFQYNPKSKKIKALTTIDITVHFTHIDSNEETRHIRDQRYKQDILGDTNEFSDQVNSAPRKRMLIITTGDLEESLNKYKGVKAITYDVSIILKEDILPLYPDKKEVDAIRSYIMEEDMKNPISYLILGGGIDKIPTHMIKLPVSRNKVACDNYYCSKDGSPLPQFCVGRFPASTPQEMAKIADFAAVHNQFSNDTCKTTIFTSYNDPKRGYEQCLEDIAEKLETISSEFAVTRRYDGKCNKDDLITSINKGAGFINYRGHGNYYKWQSKNGLSVKDVSTLNVGNNTPHVLSIACSTNGIHKKNCFGASWIKNLKAISFLGASAPSFTLVNHIFTKFLWEALQKPEITTIGDAFVWATIALYKNESENTANQIHINILEYLLLGDPTSDYMVDSISVNA